MSSSDVYSLATSLIGPPQTMISIRSLRLVEGQTPSLSAYQEETRNFNVHLK